MSTIYNLPSAVRVRDQTFRFNQSAEVSRSRGRYVQAKADPFSYWSASFDLVPLLEDDYGRFVSFTMKVRAGVGFFRGYNTGRPRPLAEDAGVALSGTRAGGGAFDGTATIAAITDSLTVSLSGLPAGFKLLEGDMIEFAETSERLSLHMIAEDVTADGSGDVDITLNNPLDTENFTTSGTANLEKPSCIMQIFNPPDHSKGVRFGSGSFEAQEFPL